MPLILYGIPNCDTIKRARKWLDSRSVAYDFHDYKKVGVDAAKLREWVGAVGWEPLLNTRGTTFRKLADADKTGIDAAKAVRLMAANPSMIKRPVAEACPERSRRGADDLIVGFDAEGYEARFG